MLDLIVILVTASSIKGFNGQSEQGHVSALLLFPISLPGLLFISMLLQTSLIGAVQSGDRMFTSMSLWFTGMNTYYRAVRLIEIEIKSRFEIARFLNRFIARFFFLRPCPNLPQYAIRTNQNAAEQNRPGIQTDSMLKKQGRWVQNRIRTWWPKKCMLHAEHTAGSVAIIFPSEQRASFWRSRSAHAQHKMPLW